MTPSAPAIVDGGRTTTYDELDTLTDALARTLVAAHVHAGGEVPVVAAPSAEMIVAHLAVLKASAVCVPLEVPPPPAALHAAVDEGGASVVLTCAGVDLPPMPGTLRIDAALTGDYRLPAPLPDDPPAGTTAYRYRCPRRGLVDVAHEAVARPGDPRPHPVLGFWAPLLAGEPVVTG